MKKSLKGEFCDGFLTISYNYKVDIGFHSAAKMGKDTLILFSDKIIKQNNKLKQTSISLFLSHIVGKFHLSSRVDGFWRAFCSTDSKSTAGLNISVLFSCGQRETSFSTFNFFEIY